MYNLDVMLPTDSSLPAVVLIKTVVSTVLEVLLSRRSETPCRNGSACRFGAHRWFKHDVLASSPVPTPCLDRADAPCPTYKFNTQADRSRRPPLNQHTGRSDSTTTSCPSHEFNTRADRDGQRSGNGLDDPRAVAPGLQVQLPLEPFSPLQPSSSQVPPTAADY